jgi:hypothetical protein
MPSIPDANPPPAAKLPKPMRWVCLMAIKPSFGHELFWILALVAHGDLVDYEPTPAGK